MGRLIAVDFFWSSETNKIMRNVLKMVSNRKNFHGLCVYCMQFILCFGEFQKLLVERWELIVFQFPV